MPDFSPDFDSESKSQGEGVDKSEISQKSTEDSPELSESKQQIIEHELKNNVDHVWRVFFQQKNIEDSTSSEGKEVIVKKVISELVDKDILFTHEGNLAINSDKLKNTSFQKKEGGLGKIRRHQLIDVLKNTKAIDISDLKSQGKNKEKVSLQKFLPVPDNLEDFALSFGPSSVESEVNVWELGLNPGWKKTVELSDSTELTTAEMYVANLLQKLQARRRGGELEILDPNTNEYRNFSATYLVEELGIAISVRDNDGNTIHFPYSSKFPPKFLPNLLDVGLLEMSDFSRQGGTEGLEDRFGSSWRELKPTTPYNSFSNENGLSAKYYTGKGVIPGTNIDQRETEVSIKKLDSNTVGIFTESNRRKRLRYTLDLLDDATLEKKRAEAREKLEADKVNEGRITNYTNVSATEMEELVKEFDIVDVVPRHKGESADDYARRVARLSDYEHITDNFQEFVAETGINALDIPWNEQIILADAVTEAEKEKLIEFTQKFGKAGLRTFLSVDYGSEMTQTIFKIANNLSEQKAQEVFNVYSQIIDATKDAQEVVEHNIDTEIDTNLANTITDKIYRDGKKVLEDVANKSEDPEKALEDLGNISRKLQALLGSLYGLVREGHELNLDTLKGISFEKINSTEISSDMAEQMREIYRNNYPEDEYSEEFQQELVEKLNDLITSEDSEFYTLSHESRLKGFVGFKQEKSQADGQPIKQAAAFNVDPSFQDHAIGHLMIENTLSQEAEEAVLVANSKAHSQLTSRYIERGFVGTRVSSQESGPDLLDIVWDKNTNQSCRFKPMVEEEIIRLFTENQVQGAAEFSTGEKIKKVNSLADLNYIDLDEDKVLTRLFEYEDGWLAVFEPAPDKEYPESIK